MQTKLRHRVVYALLRYPFKLYLYGRYRYQAAPFQSSLPGPYLICGNHTQVFDPFFMALSFKEPIYFVASDMIFLHPLWGRLIAYLVAPIPKTKVRSDIETIRDIRSIIKSGGSIGVFPSGNSAYSGEMLPIDVSIAKLAKLLKQPLCLYRIEGGYLAHPRWAKYPRKGRLVGRVSEVIDPETIAELSIEALHQRIVAALNVNDFNQQPPVLYRGKAKAEAIENAYYLCPQCHAFETLHSQGDTVVCRVCDWQAMACDDGTFQGPKLTHNPNDWFSLQSDVLANHIASLKPSSVVFEDHGETIYQVFRAKKKQPLGQGTLTMTLSEMTLKAASFTKTFDLANLSLSVQQKNRLIVYDANSQETYYCLNGDRRNAIKYEHALSIIQGGNNDV